MATNRKMSLVARFDDLCRYTAVLTENSDAEFRSFVINQEECRKRWLQAELERQRLEMLYNKDKKHLEGSLEYCRKMYSQEIKRRKSAEQERDSLKSQLDLIKEIILDKNAVNDQTREKLAFLNNSFFQSKRFESPQHLNTIDESAGSILSPSDIDLTDENLDEGPSMRTRSRLRIGGTEGKRRPSAPPLFDDTPPKKTKINEISTVADITDSVIATTTVTVPFKGPIVASSKIETSGGSQNQKVPDEEVYPNKVVETPIRNPKLNLGGNESDESMVWMETGLTPKPLRDLTLTRNTLKKTRYSLGKLALRPHDFVTKTVIKPEKCICCDKRIKFGKLALRCKDCRTTSHIDCKDQVPLPCTPVVTTPAGKGLVGSVIGDFAPKNPPLIPALILHCVMEVEQRGLTETGLYRVPGSEREVKELKEKFLRGKGIPKLSKLDINVVCGCIKDFLRSMKEPIVTYNLWPEFVQIAELPNEKQSVEKLKTVISKLPITNRDTLAYLVMHLQLVAKSEVCKMPASNLARVFGPTLVGYSSPEPEPAAMLHETKQQARVIERLMLISQDYWAAFINIHPEPPTLSTPGTPDRRLVSETIFGSLTPSASRSSLTMRAKTFLNHTPLGPRDGVKTRSYKRTQKFFASPMLH